MDIIHIPCSALRFIKERSEILRLFKSCFFSSSHLALFTLIIKNLLVNDSAISVFGQNSGIDIIIVIVATTDLQMKEVKMSRVWEMEE